MAKKKAPSSAGTKKAAAKKAVKPAPAKKAAAARPTGKKPGAKPAPAKKPAPAAGNRVGGVKMGKVEASASRGAAGVAGSKASHAASKRGAGSVGAETIKAAGRGKGARALATRVTEAPRVDVVTKRERAPRAEKAASKAASKAQREPSAAPTQTAPLAIGTIEAKPALEPVPDARTPDLASAIQRSRLFFASHNLGHLASAIPTAGAFDEGARTQLADAALVGLDDLVVFPPVSLQQESFLQLVRQLAHAPASGLESDQQYGEPWVLQPDQMKQFSVRARPRGAYALAVSSGAFDPETANRSGAQLDTLLEQWQVCSLTVMEYLVLQRMRAETHNDHRFDLNPVSSSGGADGGQWQWLLDSREGEGSKTRYAMASWNPKLRRVEIGICPSESASPRKGTHATRVVAAIGSSN